MTLCRVATMMLPRLVFYGFPVMTVASVLNHLPRVLISALAGFVATTSPAAAVVFNPLIGGAYPEGITASSQWVQVKNDWRGVIYGSEGWGDGIWGLADAKLVLGPTVDDSAVIARYSDTTHSIQYADQQFLDFWGAIWGSQTLAPILVPGLPHTQETYDGQENWAVRFTGQIAIGDSGLYNFGVLSDDGFSFSLFGAEGSLGLLQDGLNPRDRLGFASNLELLPGLYGFELVAWERLQAGVVSLDWFRVSIPSPATAWLLLPGLAALAFRRRV